MVSKNRNCLAYTGSTKTQHNNNEEWELLYRKMAASHSVCKIEELLNTHNKLMYIHSVTDSNCTLISEVQNFTAFAWLPDYENLWTALKRTSDWLSWQTTTAFTKTQRQQRHHRQGQQLMILLMTSQKYITNNRKHKERFSICYFDLKTKKCILIEKKLSV